MATIKREDLKFGDVVVLRDEWGANWYAVYDAEPDDESFYILAEAPPPPNDDSNYYSYNFVGGVIYLYEDIVILRRAGKAQYMGHVDGNAIVVWRKRLYCGCQVYTAKEADELLKPILEALGYEVSV